MPEHNIVFEIRPDGDMLIIKHPNTEFDTGNIGEGHGWHTGGHVWPQGKALRLAFKVLRFVFGRKGIVAEWTRTWGGPWVLVDPVLNVTIPEEYETHADACDAEVRFVLSGDGQVYWGWQRLKGTRS